MSVINPETLKITSALYCLGKHRIDQNVTGEVPVYLEFDATTGYTIRAQLGNLNPWYLNAEPRDQFFTMKDRTKKYGYTTYWRYKRGTRFLSLDSAIFHFNNVVYGELKPKPSELELK